MAKSIRTSNNYILIDDEGGRGLLAFPKVSYYSESLNSFTIRIKPRSNYFEIQFAKAGDWKTEDGITSFTEETLRAYLRDNTFGDTYPNIPKISPGTPNMDAFKFTVDTAASGTSGVDQFTIPIGAGTFLYDVTTSDGYSATGLTGNHTITFPTGAGTHNVEITGSFPAAKFNSSGDRNKFSTIENFGIYGINSLDQTSAFYGCSNLLVNATDIGHLENVTNFTQFFRSCGSIKSIPRFNTSSATTLAIAFFGCGQLETFPLIDTSGVLSLNFTFTSCSSLIEFPLIDVSSVTNFSQAWFNCNSMTSFPAINPISSTSFNKTWGNCASLETFKANVFNNSISTSNYTDVFLGTNLTEQSIDNILVSMDSNGVSNGTFAQSGGSTPSAIGLAAKDSLVAKGWTIVYTL